MIFYRKNMVILNPLYSTAFVGHSGSHALSASRTAIPCPQKPFQPSRVQRLLAGRKACGARVAGGTINDNPKAPGVGVHCGLEWECAWSQKRTTANRSKP